MIQAIAGHSLDITQLMASTSLGLSVLDVGARGFQFAIELIERFGSTVYALDPGPDIEAPKIDKLHFYRLAIVPPGMGESVQLARGNDPEADHLIIPGSIQQHASETLVEAEGKWITTFMAAVGVARWAAVKLNCEGAEYDILANWPGPVADQICVSFHEHTGANKGRSYDPLLAHLGQWYDVAQHERDSRYCCGENYWDSLFVRR